MLKIGVILLAIGLFLISPLDEIFILLPLSAVVGMWVFPLFIVVAIILIIAGAVLLGKHLAPILGNPIVLLMIGIAIVVTAWIIYESGWWLRYI